MAEGAVILPMQTAGTRHFIERTYREGGAFQWVRETCTSTPRKPTRRACMFGVESAGRREPGRLSPADRRQREGHVGDRARRVFQHVRRQRQADRGAHKKFGVGSKTALLPWNTYGMVVVSWVDGDASMISVSEPRSTGEYGLGWKRNKDPETGKIALDEVYEPYYDEEHGCDSANIKPAGSVTTGR